MLQVFDLGAAIHGDRGRESLIEELPLIVTHDNDGFGSGFPEFPAERFHCPVALREALAPLADRIKSAFVFGSVAKRSDSAASDIDVMVVSDSVDYAEAFTALQSAEAKLARTINPTIYTPTNWRRKKREGNSFVVRVAAQPKVFLFGTEEDLA